MAARVDPIFVGIKSSVVALERATGETIWRTDLKRGDFVNVAVDRGELYASVRGEVFRLDPQSGAILWRNGLPGLGWGVVTIAGAAQTPPAERKRRDDQAAAAAATSAAG